MDDAMRQRLEGQGFTIEVSHAADPKILCLTGNGVQTYVLADDTTTLSSFADPPPESSPAPKKTAAKKAAPKRRRKPRADAS